jgi:hypothetical protein
MEIEAAVTTKVTGPIASMASEVTAHAEGFGTRPQTGRPHSISLFGSDQSQTRNGPSRGLDVLLGVGIGAAVMYYLDPDGGPRRRALVRDKIVEAVTIAAKRHDALGAAVGLVGSALLARGVARSGRD